MKLQKIVLAALCILPVYACHAMEKPAELDRSQSHLSAALKKLGYEKWQEISNNIDITDSNGDSPLLFITRNFPASIYIAESLTMLNAQGANLNFVNKKDGMTPLLAAFYATGRRKAPDQTLAILLVKMGADVNRAARDGLTPLLLAAAYDFNDLVKLLLQPKSNVMARNYAGRTAFDFANPENRMLLLPLMRASGYVNQTLAATGQGGQQASTVKPMTVQQVQIPAKPSYVEQTSDVPAVVSSAAQGGTKIIAAPENSLQQARAVSALVTSAQQGGAKATAIPGGFVQLARAVPMTVSSVWQGEGAKAVGAMEHLVPRASAAHMEMNSVQPDVKIAAKTERSAQQPSAVPAAQPVAKQVASQQDAKQPASSPLLEMKMQQHDLSYSELWELMSPEKRIKTLTSMLQDQGYEKCDEAANNSNVTDSRGDTPLLFIARNMSARVPIALIIDLLKVCQGDIDFVNKQDGLTPLLASLLKTGKRKKADADLAMMLLSCGADVNKARPTHGLTPLMLAASDDNLSELVKIFLEKGAVTSIPDYDGKTASDYATPKNRELLEQCLHKTP